MKSKLILEIAAGAALCAGAFLWLRGSGSGEDEATAKPSGVRLVVDAPTSKGAEKKVRVENRSRIRKETAIAEAARVKPNVSELDDEESRELTDLAKKVLASLQSAIDSNDLAQIRAIIETVKNSPKGSLSNFAEGLPVALRKRLVESLGWFGNDAIPDLMEFLADSDSDVSQMAIDQFQLALEDITLGDRERADIVAAASHVVTDTDFLDMLFMEISNMRNSVAAQAMADILLYGTEEAKSLIPDTIEFVTGEENMSTVEDIERWSNDNPDGPDDEDLYGPMSTGADSGVEE